MYRYSSSMGRRRCSEIGFSSEGDLSVFTRRFTYSQRRKRDQHRPFWVEPDALDRAVKRSAHMWKKISTWPDIALLAIVLGGLAIVWALLSALESVSHRAPELEPDRLKR